LEIDSPRRRPPRRRPFARRRPHRSRTRRARQRASAAPNGRTSRLDCGIEKFRKSRKT
jgi:DNA invertase Pin-like site-specific DNA recombinase